MAFLEGKVGSSGRELIGMWDLKNSPRLHIFTTKDTKCFRILNTFHRVSILDRKPTNSRLHVCKINFLGALFLIVNIFTESTVPLGKALAALLKVLI